MGITEIFQFDYYGFFDKYGDPRLRSRFLLQDPAPLLVIIAVYLLFCLKLGPMLMERRKPLNLRAIIIMYNLVMVILSVWLIIEILKTDYKRYSFTCQPVDYSDDPSAVEMAKIGHIYFIFKVVELVDTVFFVLRKKTRQVTFLHVYHHASMCLMSWTIAKFYSGGHSIFPAAVNTSVHVIMYTYYLLAAMGPTVQKYLWWKNYLTQLQLIQFVIMLGHQGQVLVNGCDVPKFLPIFTALQAIVFLYLFGHFYFITYLNKSKTK